ncbi:MULTISPECIES: hypothetical protein, partial [Paraburkholderia]|uniref:hypothetical protein n=1 Tax=Paraburkholderia TaxID=1822464 RepID=UPI0022557C4D
QRKVGAPPHRGNANKPLTNQGKAKVLRTLTNKRREGKNKNQSLTAAAPEMAPTPPHPHPNHQVQTVS